MLRRNLLKILPAGLLPLPVWAANKVDPLTAILLINQKRSHFTDQPKLMAGLEKSFEMEWFQKIRRDFKVEAMSAPVALATKPNGGKTCIEAGTRKMGVRLGVELERIDEEYMGLVGADEFVNAFWEDVHKMLTVDKVESYHPYIPILQSRTIGPNDFGPRYTMLHRYAALY